MDETQLRKWLHDLNNRVGMILANAELMQLDQLSPRSLERTKLIEEKSLEIRQIVRDIGEHLFGK
jgi:hypothetical protein